MKKRADGRWVKSKTVNKKRIFFYSDEPTEKKAQRDIEKQMLLYVQAEAEGKPFSAAADEWSRSAFRNLTNNSLKAYKPALRSAKEYFGEISVKQITPSDVNAYINSLIRLKYAQKTIKNRLLVLNLILKHCVICGYIGSNPCVYIRLPKGLPKTKRETASELDIDVIKKNTDKPFGVFALFLAFTGCRRGEALALTPSDIDIENKVVRINKTVEWLGNHPHIKDNPKTEAGNREIPIPDSLIKHLMPLLGNNYIFQDQNGNLLDNSAAWRGWRNYQNAVGISVTPHQLRHAYATMLFDAGIDVKTAQAVLGHADIKTTLGIYTHLSESRKINSFEKLRSYADKFLTTV